MVKIFLVRHGYSIGNEKDLITGHYDCDLNEVGFKQAELVGEYIFKNLQIDAFYSSDLCRAVNTIKPAATKCNLPIFYEPAFRELSAGDWEGLTFDEASKLYPKEFEAWVNKEDDGIPKNGETWEALFERTTKRLEELMKEFNGKNIVICTHSGAIKVLQCFFMGKKVQYMTEIDWVSNASISEIWYDNGKYQIKQMGYDEYLKDIKTHLPKTI